jgi:hypothetical protein
MRFSLRIRAWWILTIYGYYTAKMLTCQGFFDWKRTVRLKFSTLPLIKKAYRPIGDTLFYVQKIIPQQEPQQLPQA